MAGLLVLLFPALLLGFLLFMGRVEEPLNRQAPEREIEQFLDDANPEELETFVQEGTDTALRRFRQRLNPRRLLRNGRRRTNGQVRPTRAADGLSRRTDP